MSTLRWRKSRTTGHRPILEQDRGNSGSPGVTSSRAEEEDSGFADPCTGSKMPAVTRSKASSNRPSQAMLRSITGKPRHELPRVSTGTPRCVKLLDIDVSSGFRESGAADDGPGQQKDREGNGVPSAAASTAAGEGPGRPKLRSSARAPRSVKSTAKSVGSSFERATGGKAVSGQVEPCGEEEAPGLLTSRAKEGGPKQHSPNTRGELPSLPAALRGNVRSIFVGSGAIREASDWRNERRGSKGPSTAKSNTKALTPGQALAATNTGTPRCEGPRRNKNASECKESRAKAVGPERPQRIGSVSASGRTEDWTLDYMVT